MLPTVKPRRRMAPALTLRALVVAAVVVIVTFVGLALVTGSGSLYAGGVTPARLALAPCPTSFWLLRNVSPPV